MRLHVVQCEDQTNSFLAFSSDMSGESDCLMVFWPEDRISALILEKQALTVSLTVAHLSTAASGHTTTHPLGMRRIFSDQIFRQCLTFKQSSMYTLIQ